MVLIRNGPIPDIHVAIGEMDVVTADVPISTAKCGVPLIRYSIPVLVVIGIGEFTYIVVVSMIDMWV